MAKIIENTMVFNDFSRFGGSKSASFSYVFKVSVPRSFFYRLGVGFGIDLRAVWASQTRLKTEPFLEPSNFEKIETCLSKEREARYYLRNIAQKHGSTKY